MLGMPLFRILLINWFRRAVLIWGILFYGIIKTVRILDVRNEV